MNVTKATPAPLLLLFTILTLTTHSVTAVCQQNLEVSDSSETFHTADEGCTVLVKSRPLTYIYAKCTIDKDLGCGDDALLVDREGNVPLQTTKKLCTARRHVVISRSNQMSFQYANNSANYATCKIQAFPAVN